MITTLEIDNFIKKIQLDLITVTNKIDTLQPEEKEIKEHKVLYVQLSKLSSLLNSLQRYKKLISTLY
jgi:hypothetical protein